MPWPQPGCRDSMCNGHTVFPVVPLRSETNVTAITNGIPLALSTSTARQLALQASVYSFYYSFCSAAFRSVSSTNDDSTNQTCSAKTAVLQQQKLLGLLIKTSRIACSIVENSGDYLSAIDNASHSSSTTAGSFYYDQCLRVLYEDLAIIYEWADTSSHRRPVPLSKSSTQVDVYGQSDCCSLSASLLQCDHFACLWPVRQWVYPLG